MRNFKEFIILSLCLSLTFFPVTTAFAAPQGGKVGAGKANIKQAGKTTTINQSSNRAIINWKSFDIAKSETVQHNMPSSNSAALHRVTGGGGASQIAGALNSNGNIYLVNPAGVVIHNGAKIKTNSFVATSKDIANDNFMKGKMIFNKPGNPDAKIINKGEITVNESGLAALVAPTVRNEGVIAAKLGKILLASGIGAWKLDTHGDGLITFTISETDLNSLVASYGGNVENLGAIKAEGGIVVLTTSQLEGIIGSVVNNGEISAASAEVKGGKVIFKGQGSGVDVVNNGKIDVSSAIDEGGSARLTGDSAVSSSGTIKASGNKQGGKVVITGREVALNDKAVIDASGANGGGTVLVGGNLRGQGPEKNAKTTKVEKNVKIHADAANKGNGGQVVVWSDGKTTFDGTITAKGGKNGGNGGQVETSGKNLKIGDSAKVDTSADKGIHGNWLLDPARFEIAASGGDITGAEVSESLQTTNLTLSSIDGEIYVNDVIEWDTDNTLTFSAYSSIVLLAPITATGDNATLRFFSPTGTLQFANNGCFNMTGLNQHLWLGNKEYAIINDIRGLQNIDLNLKGLYALGTDIDASDTKNWNSGKGFKPIGQDDPGDSDGFGFSGELLGFMRTISNLYINRPTEDNVGLFGGTKTSAFIKGVNLVAVSIAGSNNTGALVGHHGTMGKTGSIPNISNCMVHDYCTISGNRSVGGLVGYNAGGIYRSSTVIDEVSGYGLVGGFVGNNAGIIEESASGGAYVVSHDNFAGGFAGYNNGSLYNKDTGKLEKTGMGIIKNSYSKVNSIGEGHVVLGSSSLNSFGGFIGGLAVEGSIINCYSYPIIIDGLKSGLFAGEVYGNVSISDCYYFEGGEVYDTYPVTHHNGIGVVLPNGTTGESPIKIEVTPLSQQQMADKSSFKNWDFKNIWDAPAFSFMQPSLKAVGWHDYELGSGPSSDTSGETTNPDVSVNPDQPANPTQPDNPGSGGSTSGGNTSTGGSTSGGESSGSNTGNSSNSGSNSSNSGSNMGNSNNSGSASSSSDSHTGNSSSGNSTNTSHGTTSGNSGNSSSGANTANADSGNSSNASGNTGEIGNNNSTINNNNITILNDSDKTSVDKENQNIISTLWNKVFPKKELNVEEFEKDEEVIESIQDLFAVDFEKEFKKLNPNTAGKIDDVKNNITLTSTQVDKVTQDLIANKPDDLYEAFALAILQLMDASTIEKYETSMEKFTLQLKKNIEDGSKSSIQYVTIGNITYTIDFKGFFNDASGLASVHITWKGTDGKSHYADMVFASNPKDTMKSLAKYCQALNKINQKAWESASLALADLVTGKLASDVYKALTGKKDSINTLTNKLGTNFNNLLKKEYSGSFTNFVKEVIPNGEKLIKAAQAIETITKQYKEIITIIKKGGEIAEHLADFKKACKDLETNYPSDGVKALSAKLTKLLKDIGA